MSLAADDSSLDESRAEFNRLLVALPFREIWLFDFEFNGAPGDIQNPVCLIAWELKSGRRLRLFRDEFGDLPPYTTDACNLFVAYYASAEIGCHLSLGWSLPVHVLDLFTEFRCRTNGLQPKYGASLLGALAYFRLGSITKEVKTFWRNRVMAGGPFSDEEKAGVLTYCETDVVALADLLPFMLPNIIDNGLEYALLRGRYMKASARMEFAGAPLDVDLLGRLKKYWPDIQDELIAGVDHKFGVYEGRTLKRDLFTRLLTRLGIPWVPLEKTQEERGAGKPDVPDLSDDAFKEMAVRHPVLIPLRDLRADLSAMRLIDLTVGRDGRNRTILSAFRAVTSRNQPSNSKFIFGPSVFLRSLIKPQPGYGLAYIDFCQQEFGIAATCSRDPVMMAAYRTGDPYLDFAKKAGAVPPDAMKRSHKTIRELYKTCSLGVLYGMEAFGLAKRIEKTRIEAQALIDDHRRVFKEFWKWSDRVVNRASQFGYLETVFKWPLHVRETVDPMTRRRRLKTTGLRNFLMQANGAEMLRYAIILATEAGIEVCAPVHDAVLIRAPLERLDADIAKMQECMRESSRIVLSGFQLRTEALPENKDENGQAVSIGVRYPDRYMDEREGAREMWERVLGLLDKATGQ